MDAEIISSLKKCLQEKEGHLTHLAVELEEKRADIERLHFENEDLNRKIQYQEIEYQTKLDRLRDANESLVIEIQNEMDAKLKYQRMCIELEEKNGELSFCLTEAQVFLDEEKNKRNNSSVAISVAQATNGEICFDTNFSPRSDNLCCDL
jgi:hypothetical protein